VAIHTDNPIIPALGRWRQEDHKFEASLESYQDGVTKKKKKKNKERKDQRCLPVGFPPLMGWNN
jgi:hypothetical protein